MSKYLTGIVIFFILTSIITSGVNADSTENKGIVIFTNDDLQEDWLEDVAVKLVEAHISMDIPVVLGVIPYELDKPYGSLKMHLKKFYKNHPDIVEIAQHGYDHTHYLEGKSYDEQKTIIKNGLDIFQSLGIRPYTYSPPFGSVDETTLEVLNDLGFHTLINPTSDIEDGLTIVAPLGVPLCENMGLGSSCVLKSAEVIMEEVDLRIEEKGVTTIFYHMQDFATENDTFNQTKYNQFLILLDTLKDSGKYRFMTAEQYHQSVTSTSMPLIYLFSIAIVIIIGIAIRTLMKRKKRMEEKF